MKFVLVHFATAKEDWSDRAIALYTQKISYFVDFEVVAMRPSKNARGDEKSKLRDEAKALREFLKDGDQLVIFD